MTEVKKRCQCGMPLDKDTECSCNTDKCIFCCECPEDCKCGCKEKADKVDEGECGCGCGHNH